MRRGCARFGQSKRWNTPPPRRHGGCWKTSAEEWTGRSEPGRRRRPWSAWRGDKYCRTTWPRLPFARSLPTRNVNGTGATRSPGMHAVGRLLLKFARAGDAVAGERHRLQPFHGDLPVAALAAAEGALVQAPDRRDDLVQRLRFVLQKAQGQFLFV